MNSLISEIFNKPSKYSGINSPNRTSINHKNQGNNMNINGYNNTSSQNTLHFKHTKHTSQMNNNDLFSTSNFVNYLLNKKDTSTKTTSSKSKKNSFKKIQLDLIDSNFLANSKENSELISVIRANCLTTNTNNNYTDKKSNYNKTIKPKSKPKEVC